MAIDILAAYAMRAGAVAVRLEAHHRVESRKLAAVARELEGDFRCWALLGPSDVRQRVAAYARLIAVEEAAEHVLGGTR